MENMTTTLDQLGHWLASEFQADETKVKILLSTEEALVVAKLKPLVAQIVLAAEAVGKTTFQESLAVLEDAAKSAVVAGASALPAGPQAATAAAEAAFLATGASEGITVVRNAESALIKAEVAAVQGVPPVTTTVAAASAATAS